jgi:hypothetical protein
LHAAVETQTKYGMNNYETVDTDYNKFKTINFGIALLIEKVGWANI